MIYLLKNVGRTQDVPLDGTISSVMPAKTTATCMNTNIPIELS